jgi:arylsulfatase
MTLSPPALVLFFLIALAPLAMPASETYQPRLASADKVEVYKTTPESDLVVNLFEGRGEGAAKRPAIMFFFGGGWVKGGTAHFKPQAQFFAERGYTVLLPDYRVASRHGTTVREAVEDAADAYRWLLKNAERLNIDPQAIVLAGGSAGGHLALSIPLLHPELPLPAALVAYNPVTQTTPGGYHTPGAFASPEDVGQLSLHDKARQGLPPLLVIHGDADKTVPRENSRDFVSNWQAHGNTAELVTVTGAGHGFFNSGPSFQSSLEDTVGFLEKTKAGALSASLAAPQKVANSRPNILFILVDDMGYSDPGFLGGDIKTPHLDRLAREGTVFGRFLNHAKCEPSRASLLTGVHFQRQTQDHVTREFRNVATVAERLWAAGYRTLSAGKWHLPGKPTEHGFDRFFGLQGGASNHFDPTNRLGLDAKLHLSRDLLLDDRPVTEFQDDFYSTDAFTDYALKFIKETPADRPFFLYLAYTAPHWPLQAPAETIEKYRGRYDGGWKALQASRFENLQKSGFLPAGWTLPEMKLSGKDTNDPQDAQLMEVHAAMVDRMDEGIGRILKELEAEGRLENTLILFASDNGPIGKIGAEGRFDRTPERPAGPVDSFRMLPEGFMHAVNTPWQGQKLTHLAGGNTSPLIAFWPRKVPAGKVSWETINILDVMPTLLTLSGATYPSDLMSLDGRDISPQLTGAKAEKSSDDPQFLRLHFSEADERAILEGHWKAYRNGTKPWRLFDLLKDGTETQDLSTSQPEKLKHLVDQFSLLENQTSNQPQR